MTSRRISPSLRSFAAVSLAAAALLTAAPAVAQSSMPLGPSSGFPGSIGVPEEIVPSQNPYVATDMTSAVLFAEGFDDIENPAKFTHSVPPGWGSTSDGVTSGEERWNGWSFSTIRDWTWASGTDMRHWFTRGHGQVAVIDSKQQRLNATDSMVAALSTPDVDVSGHEKVVVNFDHHYRQGGPEQLAEVLVSFDGDERQIAEFREDTFSRHEAIEVDVPAGAETMSVSFRYVNGNDDWWWAVDNVAVTTPLGEVQGEPTAIVDVLSDVQGDIADYEMAVTKLNGQPDPAGALVVNGDLVDTGEQHLWDEFLAATERAPHASGTEVWTIGNHEMYGPEGSETYLGRFLEYSGQERPWTEVVVDGVPLITVNTEYYSDVDRGGKEPFQRISREQLDWLDSRLAHWDEQGTPALVFTHPLLPQTVSMSHSAWYQNDFEDTEAISDVLNKYNNIVLFTSHSHADLALNDWWGMRRYEGTGAAGRQGFPVVNTGAITNAYVPDGDHDETRSGSTEETATGLRVKVFEDRVRVEAWDFKTGPDGTMMKFQDFPRAL